MRFNVRRGNAHGGGPSHDKGVCSQQPALPGTFFAPTILDGGVAKFATGEVAEQVIGGFLRAAATDKVLRDTNASASPGVTALTFLAGAKNVDSTREGIEKAIAAGKRK